MGIKERERITEESHDFVTGQGSQEEGCGRGEGASQVPSSARSLRNSCHCT